MLITLTSFITFWRNHRFSLSASMLVIVAGIILTGFAMNFQEQRNHQIVQQAANKQLTQITESLRSRLSLYQYALSGLQGSIRSVGIDNFDYATMLNYTSSRDYETEFPGARGFGLILYVPADGREQYLQTIAKFRPNDDFAIKQLAPHNESLFVVTYIEPEIKNKQAVGLDIGSESVRRDAALLAARSGEIQLTAPLTLVQANDKQAYGFLLLMPLYASNAELIDAQQRMRSIQGWVYAPLLIDEVILASIDTPDNVVLSITDNAVAEQTQFFVSANASNVLPHYQQSANMSVYGRDWQLTLDLTPAFINALQLDSPILLMWQAIVIIMIILLLIAVAAQWKTRQQITDQLQIQLMAEREQFLLDTNVQLEKEVSARTREIASVSMLQKSILESAGYAIVATDPEGIITLFNPAAEGLLGYTHEELVGKATPSIFHLPSEIEARASDLSDEFNRTILPGFAVFTTRALAGKREVSNWTYVTKHGEHKPVRLTVDHLIDDEGNTQGFIGIAFDLSQQKEHEQALTIALRKAQQASIAKSNFLANMSHEIRTPMTGILGSLDLLREENLSEQGMQIVDKAMYSSSLLTQIINDILDISKIEANKMQIEYASFSFSHMLTHLMFSAEYAAKEKNNTISLSNALKHDRWIGDMIRIRQVLLNLLSNANKFTENGNIIIKIRRADEDAGINITVRDSGIGMSKEQVDRLFERFEQADASTTREYGGTGLGLAISQSLVQLMNGTISCSSIVDLGSTFTVFLPLQRCEDRTHEKQVEVAGEFDFSGKRILVAEDNDINQSIIEGMLSNVNAELYFANNGQHAIDVASQQALDVILMDIQMPQMDGVEACNHIKKIHPDLPIIAFTANVMADDIKHYTENGFADCVSKPIDKQKLFATLHKHLQG